MQNFDPTFLTHFQTAVAQHNAGQLDNAKIAYQAALQVSPNSAETLHNLGLLCIQQGDLSGAEEWMGRAVVVDSFHPVYLSNYGNVLQDLNRFQEAVPQYQRAIFLKPDFVDAHYNLGNAFQKIGQSEAAVESYNNAISLNLRSAEIFLNLGNAYLALGRYNEALQSYARAIEANPNYYAGYNNLGSLLSQLGRHDEALAAYNQASSTAKDPYLAYIATINLLLDKGQLVEALEKAEIAIKMKPMEAQAYYLAGLAAYRMRDIPRSVARYRRAIELRPEIADGYNGLGLALMKAGFAAFDEAQECFRKALSINPDFQLARINLADSYFTRGNLQEALNNFQMLSPDLQPLGLMQFFKQQLGDWSNYEADRDNFLRRIRDPRLLGLTEDPWHLQRIDDSPALSKEVAQNFCRTALRVDAGGLPPIPKRAKGPKIKIGFFSPDFRDHAVAHLALEMFETIDRSRFETYAFAFGLVAPMDTLRPRLIKAFDHFIEINDKNDPDAAKLARELGIDIAFDLAGITSEARPGIFANRAAPIQVNYLGFTGTLGTNFHDYIIADETVIPKEDRIHYTEKVVYLPCMMPFDSRHQIHDKKPSRPAAGLPAEGFIFCSFNQCFKFTPDIFDSWMRILLKVPGSYLWISGQRMQAMENFKKEAARRNVDPQRIIFAPRIQKIDEHLARMQCGDLFLDTFPYNSHTSAIDALWAGVPILTRMGKSFPSRLAGSLVKTIGLADMIVPSVEAYETLAIELASKPTMMANLKKRLMLNLQAYPLFNTKVFTANFEKALIAMYDCYQADLPKDHIEID